MNSFIKFLANGKLKGDSKVIKLNKEGSCTSAPNGLIDLKFCMWFIWGCVTAPLLVDFDHFAVPFFLRIYNRFCQTLKKPKIQKNHNLDFENYLICVPIWIWPSPSVTFIGPTTLLNQNRSINSLLPNHYLPKYVKFAIFEVTWNVF